MKLSDLDAVIEVLEKIDLGDHCKCLPGRDPVCDTCENAALVFSVFARLREWRANAKEGYVTPENGWGNRVFTIDRTWDDQRHALLITTPREER